MTAVDQRSIHQIQHGFVTNPSHPRFDPALEIGERVRTEERKSETGAAAGRGSCEIVTRNV